LYSFLIRRKDAEAGDPRAVFIGFAFLTTLVEATGTVFRLFFFGDGLLGLKATDDSDAWDDEESCRELPVLVILVLLLSEAGLVDVVAVAAVLVVTTDGIFSLDDVATVSASTRAKTPITFGILFRNVMGYSSIWNWSRLAG
jgi:hypothetical protein